MVSDDEWNRNIRKTIKTRRPETTDKEIDLLSSSSTYWGSENYRSAATWIGCSLELLDDPVNAPNAGTFINLNGLLHDIPKFLKYKAKIFSLLGIDDNAKVAAFIETNKDDRMRKHFELLWSSYRSAQGLREPLSENDLFMLAFYRHRYCHPILTKYSVRIDGHLGTSKFKIEKWKRLLELGTVNKENRFKCTILEKIKPSRQILVNLIDQLNEMSRP